MGIEGPSYENDSITSTVEKKDEITSTELKEYSFNRAYKTEVIRQKEVKEEEVDSIQGLLKNHPNNEQFYILNGNYYQSNPSLYSSDITDTIYVKIISRENLKDRLNVLKEYRIEERIKTLDALISEKTYSSNVRNLLIDIRIGLSGFDNTSDISITLGESLNEFFMLLDKSEKESLSLGECSDFLWAGMNVARTLIADGNNYVMSSMKDLTSSRIYQFGEADSEFEEYLEGNIIGSPYIFDFAEEGVLTAAKIPPAILAGGIDGFLDYMQANVDIALAPDKVLQNIKDLFNTMSSDLVGTMEGIVDCFGELEDAAYLASYIAVVIMCLMYLNPGIGIATLPKILMGGIRKLGLTEETLTKVGLVLDKDIERIASAVTKKIGDTKALQKVFQTGTKIRDTADTSGAMTKKFIVDIEKLNASRRALNVVNNSLLLADIFGEKIQTQLDNKSNTEIALRVYEEEILKGNGFLENDIDASIGQSSGELKYNLILVKEKFEEIEEVMNKEIMPIVETVNELDENRDVIGFFKYKNEILNSSEYSELTKLISEKYLLKK